MDLSVSLLVSSFIFVPILQTLRFQWAMENKSIMPRALHEHYQPLAILLPFPLLQRLSADACGAVQGRDWMMYRCPFSSLYVGATSTISAPLSHAFTVIHQRAKKKAGNGSCG